MIKSVNYRFFAALLVLCLTNHYSFAENNASQTDTIVDLFADTWVATDGLGRTMPTAAQNPIKDNKQRTAGIFYITWHTQGHHKKNKDGYGGDVTKTLQADPQARFEAYNPAWKEWSLHWGEPEDGYFLSQDEYIIRKDMSMLTDAGIDLLFLDVTNGAMYWDEWDVLFRTMEKMIAEGNKVPKMCFWTFNGNAIKVVNSIYEKIYKPGLHKDLWFMWEGKPLLCYNANPAFDANGRYEYKEKYNPEIFDFFTLRNLWWGYYKWDSKRYVGADDSWCFGYEMNDPNVARLSPEGRASHHEGRIEQVAVTPAQHSISTTGKSWRVQTGEPPLNQYDMPDSAYVPWLGKKVANPEGYGIYFQDRWDEALSIDPELIYLNDWNEWTAGKFMNPLKQQDGKEVEIEFLGRQNEFYFVDQYNSEFNRTIQPMKGGYTDNYYMQLVQNMRRYKGVRPIPVAKQRAKMKIDGKFSDWNKVKNEFRDTRGDVAHRDHNGYGNLHYTNTSGRNDIIASKVSFGKKNAYFYVRTDSTITPDTDPNWMMLFINVDSNNSTGWQGYNYMVNKQYATEKGKTALMKYENGQWQKVAEVPYAVDGCEMELSIPIDIVGGNEKLGQFDFKWADNPQALNTVIDLCTDGDTAPNRRFNYRYKWNF
ncbi:MAG: hypothetical protein NC343_03190 [Muribaculum sp.]|nr:hypothetical protein [Muribaculaceae bacterium]MCM1080733.1 hypothetical protein [Muribaculum sp.]